MTPKEINIAIAESAGVKPCLESWCVVNEAEDAIVINSKHRSDCEQWLKKLPQDSPYKTWHVKPFYRYPDYCGSLDIIVPFIGALPEIERVQCLNILIDIMRVINPRLQAMEAAFSTPAQWCEAYLRSKYLY